MSNLVQLFSTRDTLYNKTTDVIIKKMDKALSAVKTFVTDTEDINHNDCYIDWVDIQLTNPDNIIMINGLLSHKINSMIIENGSSVMISEENVLDYQRHVTVGLPLNIIENGTEENVLEFLLTIREGPIDQVSDQIDIFEETDFNFDELTEEQQKSYMNNLTGTIN